MLYRGFTVIAGVLAAVVILLSQSFYQQAQDNLKKVKTEQSTDHAQEVIISAPADAVPGSSAIQMDDNVPTFVKSIPSEDKEQVAVPFATKILVSYYRILLRVLISPNAP